ncbi:MAG: hypothetical protein JO097_04320 [Acidobacteriaceae bacterium]|nr:hypothetical protein [Acidobacteriaceae bacterium]MBV9766821.1 hypothetical protein [Acidobacteriaceae bacterium]
MSYLGRWASLIPFCLASLSFVCSGATVSGFGNGGAIPPGAPLLASGEFTSNIVIASSGYVTSGNAVTVILKGLQHEWAGDLIGMLSYINSQGNAAIATANLFFRIGRTPSQPYGSWAQFGVPGPAGDNYLFNSGFAGNIWPIAATAGSADVIPGLQTDTVNGGQYFTSDAGGVNNTLSSDFTGLNVHTGTWRLTLIDATNHVGELGATPNVGSLVGWELDVQTQTTAVASFCLNATPYALGPIAPGKSVTYTVTVSPVNGFTGPTTLSLSGLPSGISGSFSVNPVVITSNSAVSSLLTVSTSTEVAGGTYPITVTGQSGSLTHSTSATLYVL